MVSGGRRHPQGEAEHAAGTVVAGGGGGGGDGRGKIICFIRVEKSLTFFVPPDPRPRQRQRQRTEMEVVAVATRAWPAAGLAPPQTDVATAAAEDVDGVASTSF